jgi:hypothetical protein
MVANDVNKGRDMTFEFDVFCMSGKTTHKGKEPMKNTLTTDEFRFIQHALRGGIFDYFACGCERKGVLLEAIFEVDDDDSDVDLERLADKIMGMSGIDSGTLIEQINRCYFAEAMDLQERHASDIENERGFYDDIDPATLN